MPERLVRFFIKNWEEIEEPRVRSAYGILTGVVGLLCNFLLFAAKLTVGLISHSVAVTADAMNNLSDASSSILTLFGFLMAKKPADDAHPFGHARFEYLSGLAVAAMILLIGAELVKSSVGQILNPEAVSISPVMLLVLAVSIVGKLWLSHFQRTIGRKIHSSSLAAAAQDSRNDVITTAAVLLSALLSRMFSLELDGPIGLCVACWILYSGIQAGKETIKPLLGAPADPELVHMIVKEFHAFDPRILGMHDLMVHDYGPGQQFASVHAEIDCRIPVLEAHELLDQIERMFWEKHHIQLVTHYDPVVTDNEELNRMREQVQKWIHGYDQRLTIHDFRMVRGKNQINLIFDLVLPDELRGKEQGLRELLEQLVKRQDERYHTVITFDTESFNRL